MRSIAEPQEITSEDILDGLVNDYISHKRNEIIKLKQGNVSKETFMKEVAVHIENYYHATQEVREEARKLFEQYVFSYFRLTPLLDDPDISDIRCISHDNIRIKREGKRMDSGISFRSPKEYEDFVQFVATRNQANISNLNAIQRFTDDDSNDAFILRFTISMPLVNTYDSPYLCIRKVPKDFPEIRNLIEKKMLSAELAVDLIERFRSGSTLICGGNSSGKTTLLNALKETLPDDMAVLVAQQADELTSKYHPDMMFMHSLPGNGESAVSYNLENISIAGLTMDVDFFIIGEIKGREAAYLLNAAYSGQLCAATVHAPSADKAADKIVDYSISTGVYSKSELLKMLLCFHTVVYMDNYKVAQVYEIAGWDEKKQSIIYKTIYERKTK